MKEEKRVHKKTEVGLNCPNCGQFMGPVNMCPYCRTKVKDRISIKTMKSVSLLISVFGIALLLVWANLKDDNEMNIGDITKKQNYAYLEIEGRVVEDSRYDFIISDTGEILPNSISFKIDDGTGLLDVRTYQEVTKELIREKKIPVNGDWVKVVGNVNFRGDYKAMTLQSVDQLKIIKETPSPITIDDIFNKGENDTGIKHGKMVSLEGVFPGGKVQQEDYDILFYDDEYDTVKILLKDNKDLAVIYIPHTLLGAYRKELDEKTVDELSFKNNKNTTDIRISVTGHLVWDKYTSFENSEHRGSWVVVPRTLDDIILEV